MKGKDERFGIELDQWSTKGHDGRVGKYRYFTVKFGYGTFVTKSAIIEKMTSTKATAAADSSFDIGDYVLVKDNRKGYIRFIGTTGLVRYRDICSTLVVVVIHIETRMNVQWHSSLGESLLIQTR